MHKILIVDDEPLALAELQESFEDDGYKVVCAPSGNAALSDAEAWDCDIIITDLKMPNMNGIEMYREFVQRSFKGKAILLSGHGAESNRVKALDAGFSLCLSKPVDLDLLFQAVEGLLKEKDGNLELVSG